MKLAIISDIHANLPALRVCLDRIDAENVDKIVCLGDFVGYGPYPNECCDLLRERGIDSVLGNHDGAITGDVSLKLFREPNHSLLKWTGKKITDVNRKYLESFELTMSNEVWLAAHSSPIDPERWTYLDSALTCREVLKTVKQDFVLVGHTHRPAVIAEKLGTFKVRPGQRYVINPGSVGQSRDHDTRASFGILDTQNRSYENIRLDYSVQKVLDRYSSIGFTKNQGKQMLGV
ncbi:MAG: metallophosphoesterase family protein [Balneolales bacterium]